MQIPAKTPLSLAQALLAAFLPAGFPHSVTGDYLAYQMFDSLQAFSSSIASLLASRAVLEGLGVGDDKATPTAALLLSVAQDTAGRVATILFAHRFGTAIEPECKRYRFLADVFNDAALLLDTLVPVLPTSPGSALKIGILSSAAVLRSLCGVAAGASKATLSAHFAVSGNLAELNAKEQSQETVVSLLGLLVGTLLVRAVHGRAAVWTWMIALIVLHLWTNYLGVRAVRMRSLNRQRAGIVFAAWLDRGVVLGPDQVAKVESIVWVRPSAMRSVQGNKWGAVHHSGGGAAGTATHGKIVAYCRFAGSFAELLDLGLPGHARRIVEVTEKEKWVFTVSRDGAGRGIDQYRIMLRKGATSRDALDAWMYATSRAYVSAASGGGRGGDEKTERAPVGKVDAAFWKALEAVGWDLDLPELETGRQYRLDAGRPGERKLA